ncbi:uncharacterized protein METZ01_LOCUS395517, partial [marine metagenome]
MISNSFQLIVKRTLAHWRLLSAVVVGVVLASTIMASSVIFFDALRDVALQRALANHDASDIDVIVEAGQVPTTPESHAIIVDAMNGTIVRRFDPFLDQRELAIKTWTFFVNLPPPMVAPADCTCRTSVGRNSDNASELIECDCRRAVMMTLPDVDNRIQLVEGVMPREVFDHGTDAPLLIEGILEVPSAKMLDIRVGDIYPITPHWEDIHAEVQVLVTGVYERVDPGSDHWRIQNEAFGSRTNTLQF